MEAANALPDYGPDLLPQHAAMLAASGISPAVASERGYRSITSRVELAGPSFSVPLEDVTWRVVLPPGYE